MAELTETQRERLALVAEKHAQAIGYLRETGIDCWLTFSREGSDLLLPFVMGGILTLVNAQYMSKLFFDPRGVYLLCAAGVSFALGVATMVRMVKFEI